MLPETSEATAVDVAKGVPDTASASLWDMDGRVLFFDVVGATTTGAGAVAPALSSSPEIESSDSPTSLPTPMPSSPSSADFDAP
jgi:hypothetical protein